ncbi:hypothetical protein HaLaN_01575, partial [Haematococcus lacustris]
RGSPCTLFPGSGDDKVAAWVSQMIGKMGVLEQQLQGVKQQ